jgi:hypothetical protein
MKYIYALKESARERWGWEFANIGRQQMVVSSYK